MLKINDLLDEIVDYGDREKERYEIVIRDYEGNMHHIVSDNIIHDHHDEQVILELHSEIEE